jgi:glucose-6-phosphate 1-dehydrogenase
MSPVFQQLGLYLNKNRSFLMAEQMVPTALVIFGVTGDLSSRYLLPALSEICRSNDIRTHLQIIGTSRRAVLAEDILKDTSSELAGQFQVITMDYERTNDFHKLKERLDGLAAEQVIFYFALPPDAVLPVVNQLGEAGLNLPKYKLLMEKPFGSDYQSAKQLIEQIDKYFKPEQVFRIDHYLAKEMAQNIAVFLGSNTLFRDVWNNNFIESIEIVAEEEIGVDGRERFYEQTGALRDVLQSHLLQLAALTLMEPCPDVFDFSMMQSRRSDALKQLELVKDSVIKGQYQGYRELIGSNQSNIDTFVSLELKSNNPAWHGVPIKLVTGKRLKQKLTEIRVYFKKSQSAQSNLLRLRVQPKEGVEIDLWVKKPGYDQQLEKLPLDFSYQQYFDRLPDAYEQVIVDAMRGRSNLFASSQEVLASWQILQPILDEWQQRRPVIYQPGAETKDIKNT